jgi:hypothetical protein
VGHDRGRGAPQRDDRPSWHPEQEILPVALAASTGPAARCAWAAEPTWRDRPGPGRGAAAALRTMPVAGTLLGGRWTHRAGI